MDLKSTSIVNLINITSKQAWVRSFFKKITLISCEKQSGRDMAIIPVTKWVICGNTWWSRNSATERLRAILKTIDKNIKSTCLMFKDVSWPWDQILTLKWRKRDGSCPANLIHKLSHGNTITQLVNESACVKSSPTGS